MAMEENNAFTSLDCLQHISDITSKGKKEHKLQLAVITSVETELSKVKMSFRGRIISSEAISADNERKAKELCGEEMMMMKIFRFEDLRKQVSKCMSSFKEKHLITRKIIHVSTNSVDGCFEKSVRADSDIFMNSLRTFKAIGRAPDKKLALLLGEINILFQLCEYFMLSPPVHWSPNSSHCEFVCKGILDEFVSSEEFFAKFPCTRENILIIPDGRMFCRICRCGFRNRQYPQHHHSKLRSSLNEMNYCIGTDNKNLAVVVNKNLTAIYKAQHEIAEFVSLHKSTVLNSARSTLLKQIPDVKLTLFGQSEEGMGQSYYILKFNVSSSLMRGEQLLLAMSRAFSNTDEFQFHIQDFSDANPNVKSSHFETGLDCIFYVRNEHATELSKFLKCCSELSPDLKVLCTLFNFWSSHCMLDLADSGYLYQEVFPLMVVHFLQYVVTPPRFPNLQLDKFMNRDILQTGEEGDSTEVFDNQLKLLFEKASGDMGSLHSYPLWKLWLLMLQFFWVDFNYFHKISLQLKAGGDGTLLPHVRDDLDKDYMRICVISPLKPSNLSFSMKTHHALDYFSDCFRDSLDYYHKKSGTAGVKSTLYDYPKRIDGTSKEYERASNTRVAASPDLSIGCSLNIDSDELEQTVTTIDTSREVTATSEELSLVVEKEITSQQENSSSNDSEPNSGEEDDKEGSPDIEEFVAFSDDVTTPATTIPQCLLSSIRYLIHGDSVEKVEEVVPHIELTSEEIQTENIKHNFILSQFNPICGYCRGKGHSKEECPQEALPVIKLVSKPAPDILKSLNTGLLQLVGSLKMTAKESNRREELRSELEIDIKRIVEFKFELCLFGSSVNKFGSDASDVDLCIVFDPPLHSQEALRISKILSKDELESYEEYSLEYVNKMAILKLISRELYKSKQYKKIIRIPAKVPLIRFEYKLNNMCYRCDISVSNSLAVNNSRLLSTYALFDQRVQDLGLLVKHFGKYMDLADASHGGLSSYAYVLLAIHFLQRTDPPIIPILQQTRPPGYEDKSVKVDAWECYFCDDIKAVKKVWKHKVNHQNLADLWLEFLCYCVSKFDWDKQVISLRQIDPLSKIDKYWTNRKIGIEDPFNLSHNLGTVLSYRNANKLKKKFIEARHIFHTSTDSGDSLDWLGFDFVPSYSPPNPVNVATKPLSKKRPVVHPDPDNYPQGLSNGNDTVLLSWSNSLNEYSTHTPVVGISDCDLIEISETVILPSVVSSNKPIVTAPAPTNGFNYTSIKVDVVLLSGSTIYQVSDTSFDFNEIAAPVVTQVFPPPVPTTQVVPPPVPTTQVVPPPVPTTQVVPPTVPTTQVVPPTVPTTQVVPPTVPTTQVVPPPVPTTQVVPPPVPTTQVVPPTVPTTQVVPPPVTTQVPPPVPKASFPTQDTESESLSLEELALRVARESQDIITDPIPIISPLMRPSFHQTKSNTPPDRARPPQDSLSKSCPSDSSFPKEYEMKLESPKGTNVPLGVKSTGAHTKSPGYKTGRGATKSPQQLVRGDRFQERASQQTLVEDRTRHTARQGRGMQTARYRGRSRGIRTTGGYEIDDIFSPIYDQHRKEQMYQVYQPDLRGRGSSGRGRGVARVSTNTSWRPRY